jgi:hypothetical protein
MIANTLHFVSISFVTVFLSLYLYSTGKKMLTQAMLVMSLRRCNYTSLNARICVNSTQLREMVNRKYRGKNVNARTFQTVDDEIAWTTNF